MSGGGGSGVRGDPVTGRDRTVSALHFSSARPPPLCMADSESYLAVLKASYDYEPQPDSEDELAVKEGQILLLLERTDDE